MWGGGGWGGGARGGAWGPKEASLGSGRRVSWPMWAVVKSPTLSWSSLLHRWRCRAGVRVRHTVVGILHDAVVHGLVEDKAEPGGTSRVTQLLKAVLKLCVLHALCARCSVV